ncbi:MULTISPECIES: hypothetical protein [unclassified Mucilaginibacter]|nr:MULTISPECIES: hypothetical protein [unclassified Mucilaginibacter]MEB0260085.1 hypothetical protein [Mucilaginibacter sp. 10I4]MEB0301977.1 hypothetical protein [Mucilaginibacter sp. 5C4]
MIKYITTTLLLLLILKVGFAQQTAIYPKVTGYFSILQPLTTYKDGSFTSNFGNVYVIAFPFGVNLIKSDSFGISFEVAPAIRTEKNISKVNSVLFHPGAMFRFKHGFTFIGRMAFETSGRFGVTPVFNQVIKKGKDASLFVSVPFPVRFGNGLPASIGTGLQLGVSF